MFDEIEELLKSGTASEIVSQLKQGRRTKPHDRDKAKKALDPKRHDINDARLRPDKKVRIDSTEDAGGDKVLDLGQDNSTVRIEKVARVALSLQKKIINIAVSFCFGNPVAYNATAGDEKQEAVLKAFSRVLHDNKETSLNRKVARATFSFGECAELWYVQQKPKEHSKYGFGTKSKLRCALFSPMFGDTLYPYFDETGDLVAFSREFVRTKGNKEVYYFETYTEDSQWLWMRETGEYKLVEGFPRVNAIGKIPIVYAYQPELETEDVDSLIDRLEKLLSNFADTNDYHASPKIFVTGQIEGFAKKGEAGAVIEGEEGATAQYLSWQHAPESVRLEIETLLKMIHTLTQTPDISFDSVKGLGAVSGIALKLLFMDAHLKVQSKREIFDDYLQRRANIIKAYIGQFDTSLEDSADELEIEPEITPYTLTSELEEINMWLAANGNKPLVSHKASVKGANLTQDPEQDYEQIQEESNADNSFAIGEPIA